jgi:hypothetical protein
MNFSSHRILPSASIEIAQQRRTMKPKIEISDEKFPISDPPAAGKLRYSLEISIIMFRSWRGEKNSERSRIDDRLIIVFDFILPFVRASPLDQASPSISK